MKKNNTRIIKYLILGNLLVLLLIAAGVYFFSGKSKVIDSLLLPYNIISIFIIYTSVFLPVSAGAVFFVYTLTEEKSFVPGSVNYFITSLNLIILPLFAVYSFLILYMNPVLIEKKIWLENLSETAEFYHKEIYRNIDKDPEKAYIFTNLYLYIDPDNNEINNINENLYIGLLSKNGISHEKGEHETKFVPQLLTGNKLIEISEDFLARKDYSSAIYYSELAGNFRYSKKKSERIVQEAQTLLKRYVESDPDREILFNGKIRIDKLYNDKKYIDSYYETVDLIQLFPEDTELATHKAALLEKMKDICFFYEEIKDFIFIPGKENIIFRDTINSREAVLLCRKIVFADKETYLFNISCYFPDKGDSWTAPFGKIIGNSINMNCIGRTERRYFLPEQSRPGEEFVSVKTGYTGEDLINFSGEMNSISKISLLDLITKTKTLERGKYGKIMLITEGAERLIRCIIFPMILFISVYTGLSFMKRGHGKNYLTLLLFPLVLLSAAAAEFLIYNLNAEIFQNLIKETGILKTLLIFPLLISFEFITALYLTIKKSSASPD